MLKRMPTQRCETSLKPESFTEPAPLAHLRNTNPKPHGAAQKPIDMLTVVERQLRLSTTLDKVGGPVVISELITSGLGSPR